VCSSKLDRETGIVTVTTPAADCPVGTVFYVIGSGASYGVDYSDWLLRVVSPRPSTGHPYGEGVDVRPAEEALRESLQNGSVHPSLVEEPLAAEPDELAA
jgi:hypothetical protein